MLGDRRPHADMILLAIGCLATACTSGNSAAHSQCNAQGSNNTVNCGTAPSAAPDQESTSGPAAAGVAPTQERSQPPRPSATQQDGSPDPVRIQSVKINVDDFFKAGNGIYSLGGRRTIQIRYGWVTMSNYGELDGKACTVVTTVTRDSEVVYTYRTAGCSFVDGWVGPDFSEGSYLITVAVKADSGARGTGTSRLKVIP
jgi:hypothetical protein